MSPRIHCHSATEAQQAHSFYVLSKGLNAGRPSYKPHANCFTITCSTATQQQFYYSLCFALWKAKKFEFHLKGSVIPFLTLHDFRRILAERAALELDQQFLNSVQTFLQLDAQEANLRQQLQLLAEIKLCIIRRHL